MEIAATIEDINSGKKYVNPVLKRATSIKNGIPPK